MDLRAQVGKLFRYEIGTGYCLYRGDLPSGISLDSDIGILVGKPQKTGTYTFTLRSKCKRTDFTIIVSKKRKCAKLRAIGITPRFCSEGIVRMRIRFSGTTVDFVQSSIITDSISPNLPSGILDVTVDQKSSTIILSTSQSYSDVDPDTEYAYTLVIRNKGCVVYSVTVKGYFREVCPR